MKTIVKLLILIILLTAGTIKLKACDISFEIIQNKKEKYDIGDTLVIKVLVILTHRICPEGIKATKFQLAGLKVIGAKEWIETSRGEYERELKLVVTGTETGKVIINGIRKCEKEGGFGSLELKAEPIKS